MNRSYCAFLLPFFACGLCAQVPIDPSLAAGSQPIERYRTLYIFSDIETVRAEHPPVARLSKTQKLKIFALSTFDPGTLFVAAATAGGVMATKRGPYYYGGGEGYGKALGALSAGIASDSLFTQAVLPIAFHQDPRYFQMGPGHSFGRRLMYAITRTVVTRTNSGNATFNISELGGIAGAVALSNTYYPASTHNAGDSAARYGSALGVRMGLNIIREFFNRPTP